MVRIETVLATTQLALALVLSALVGQFARRVPAGGRRPVVLALVLVIAGAILQGASALGGEIGAFFAAGSITSAVGIVLMVVVLGRRL